MMRLSENDNKKGFVVENDMGRGRGPFVLCNEEFSINIQRIS